MAVKEEAFAELEQTAREVNASFHSVSLGQLGKCIKILREDGVSQALMAGQVKHVQIFSSSIPDLRMVKMLLRLPRKNTDALIGAVRDLIAASMGGVSGYSMIGRAAKVAIVTLAVFMALDQLKVAHDIVRTAFTLLLLRNLAKPNPPSCHCFGSTGDEPISWRTIARNVALLVCAAVVGPASTCTDAAAGDPPPHDQDFRGLQLSVVAVIRDAYHFGR